MPPKLYYHPFSSYSQKALIACYEHGIRFEPRLLEGPDSPAGRELADLWPLQRFPVLVDGPQVVMEASCVIEYLDLQQPSSQRLIPSDPQVALEVRLLDRVFDNYVMTPMQKIVFDALRPPDARDAAGVRDARQMLDTSYAWLQQRLAGRAWAGGDRFSLADCAAAPALFYADWVHPIPDTLDVVCRLRQRLLQRPSFARAVDEARPYRGLFPLGAPDRD